MPSTGRETSGISGQSQSVERPRRIRFQFHLKHIVMVQLIVGVGIPMVWVATQTRVTAEWWRMFAFDAGLMMLAVLANLVDNIWRRRSAI
jgi:hypothetical protein